MRTHIHIQIPKNWASTLSTLSQPPAAIPSPLSALAHRWRLFNRKRATPTQTDAGEPQPVGVTGLPPGSGEQLTLEAAHVGRIPCQPHDPASGCQSWCSGRLESSPSPEHVSQPAAVPLTLRSRLQAKLPHSPRRSALAAPKHLDSHSAAGKHSGRTRLHRTSQGVSTLSAWMRPAQSAERSR